MEEGVEGQAGSALLELVSVPTEVLLTCHVETDANNEGGTEPEGGAGGTAIGEVAGGLDLEGKEGGKKVWGDILGVERGQTVINGIPGLYTYE